MIGKFLRHCEDSLTASVFTHLSHLPTEAMWALFCTASAGGTLPEEPGEVESFEFWPSWDPTGTVNTKRVVPDVYIQFTRLDVIVEAKRGDYGGQNDEQWKRELTAYLNEYGAERGAIDVAFLVLGGIGREADRTIRVGDRDFRVHVVKWNSLLTQCQKMRQGLADASFKTSAARAHERTLCDLIDLFGWHGYSVGRWFDDFDFSRHRLSTDHEAWARMFCSVTGKDGSR